jgi:hypothetical protein
MVVDGFEPVEVAHHRPHVTVDVGGCHLVEVVEKASVGKARERVGEGEVFEVANPSEHPVRSEREGEHTAEGGTTKTCTGDEQGDQCPHRDLLVSKSPGRSASPRRHTPCSDVTGSPRPGPPTNPDRFVLPLSGSW